MTLNSIKLLEENIGRTHSDTNGSNIFLHSLVNKKINKWGLLKFKSFCTAKEITNKQNEETIHRLGENICNLIDQQEISLQILQTAHETLYHQNKQSNQQMIRRPK